MKAHLECRSCRKALVGEGPNPSHWECPGCERAIAHSDAMSLIGDTVKVDMAKALQDTLRRATRGSKYLTYKASKVGTTRSHPHFRVVVGR